MSKKLLSLILLVLLASSSSITLLTSAAVQDKPIVVAHLKGAIEPDIQLETMMNDFTGIQWKVVLGDITSADIQGATMLMMSKSDATMEYTSAEVNAVKSWLSVGGKTLWVAGDSDFPTDQPRQVTANQILTAVGSRLRIEACSVEDPTSNGGAPYRVLGVSSQVDPEIAYLVTGVNRALFHGPAAIVGWDGSKEVDLMERTLDSVYVVMTTDENGIIVDSSEPIPTVYAAGEEGHFPLMAIDLDYTNKNIVIATGDSPFDQYLGMYKPEIVRADRYGPDANPQEGGALFTNLLYFATVYGDKVLEQGNQLILNENDIADLKEQMTGLQTEVTSLTSDKNDLQTQVNQLTSEKNSLQNQLESAQSTSSTMQLIAVAALIVGLGIGFYLYPVLRKPVK
jgi:FtsZ-binding cell division protein ZapB